jgi:hypothetical protein
VENILNTRETEYTQQKTTCVGHSGVAQFVENIFDLEETEDTPEKTTCKGQLALANFVEKNLRRTWIKIRLNSLVSKPVDEKKVNFIGVKTRG